MRSFQLSPLAGGERPIFVLAGTGICSLQGNRLRNFGQNSAQSPYLSWGFASEGDLRGFMANVPRPPEWALFPGKTQDCGGWELALGAV